MLTQTYLKNILEQNSYQASEQSEIPVFWKKVQHQNIWDKMAFTLIIVTIDTYTVTIEGLNEMLIRRAVEAGALTLNSIEEFDALRDVIYDNTLDSQPKEFEPIFYFFEKQLGILSEFERSSDEHQQALENLELLVINANRAVM